MLCLHIYLLFILASLIHLCKSDQGVSAAASLARQVLKDTGIGTMLTLMDPSVNDQFKNYPFGLMEYYAEGCAHIDSGDLLLFMSDLQINARNAHHQNQKVGFTIRALKDYNVPFGNISTPVQQPRFTLSGELIEMPRSLRKNNMECFGNTHQESKFWYECIWIKWWWWEW
ncbi:pyridoxamine 5'-phosphate oxidase-domain-containing protein [Chlamydoabsidia padenii]|nr:pyridoxamine 5'-phosphate oxidase-domain-containing protein [Chlamydoabsidia padenii]